MINMTIAEKIWDIENRNVKVLTHNYTKENFLKDAKQVNLVDVMKVYKIFYKSTNKDCYKTMMNEIKQLI